MKITLNNNPIDHLSCCFHNKIEELSRVQWLMGKHKKVECRICRDTMDSWKDIYSPIQCGWKQINKYTWICHRCLYHRDFTPYIEQIDEAERKAFEKSNQETIEYMKKRNSHERNKRPETQS